MAYVIRLSRSATCRGCAAELDAGDYGIVAGDVAECMKCAGLENHVLLPPGDPALTRRASRYSEKAVQLKRWMPSRRVMVREGTFVEPRALARAREDCAADAKERAAAARKAQGRRAVVENAFRQKFAEKVRKLYPSIPAATAIAVAAHACAVGSGRVGRTSAAKELEDDAAHLAVSAHARHKYTDYDEMLREGFERDEARESIRPVVTRILAAWAAKPAQAN